MNFLIIFAIALALLLTAGWHFSNTIIYPDTQSLDAIYASEVEEENFDPADFALWLKEEIRIQSPHGYELFGLYVPTEGSQKTIIVVHGITVNHYLSVKYAGIFRKRGFNVLLVDQRNHGRSGGSNTTFGFYEKYDVKAWVDWVYARQGQEHLVGTHGESLGAATVLQHAAIDSRIAFIIADCPYADAEDEFAYRLKVEYHLPKFPLVPLASWITKLRTGFAFGDAAAIKTIATVQTPVFFIHGQDDDYIPPQASIDLYEAKQGKKKLYLAPNAGHAEALINNRDEYDHLVGEFLAEIGV